jgi:hypothetical protein
LREQFPHSGLLSGKAFLDYRFQRDTDSIITLTVEGLLKKFMRIWDNRVVGEQYEMRTILIWTLLLLLVGLLMAYADSIVMYILRTFYDQRFIKLHTYCIWIWIKQKAFTAETDKNDNSPHQLLRSSQCFM